MNISPKKLLNKEKNVEDSPTKSSKIKLKSINQSNNSTARKYADVTKRLDNVEYLIKIEEKNKKQLIDRYEKHIDKTEKQIEKNEIELKGIIKELNEKESKIYEIQRQKFEYFKQDISKYENIYTELEDKDKNLIIQINDLKVQCHIVYNQTFMLNEDLISTGNEISTAKKKISDLKETLVNIEKSYPKEFEFLLEDIKLEKELQEMYEGIIKTAKSISS